MIFLSWRNYSQLWFNWTEYIYIIEFNPNIYRKIDNTVIQVEGKIYLEAKSTR